MIKQIFEDSEYDQFVCLSKRLGIPVPLNHIELIVHLHGKKISHFRDRSRTVNRNYWNMILNFLTRLSSDATNFGAGYYSFKEKGGTVPAGTSSSYQWSPLGIINNANFGILVGRGTTAESFESYALATPIAHGTGANQMSHAAMAAATKAYTAGTKTWVFTFTRAFTNSSLAQIDVTEAAWYYDTPNWGYYVMVNRDLLAAPVAVPNNGVLIVQYTISLALPA